jgi:hypothetical protein
MLERQITVAGGGSHVSAAPILRPRSRSASVIDRLPHDHPRRTLVLDRRPGNRTAILRSEISSTGAMAVPIAGVRLGHSTTRRRGGRRPPREDPA